MIPDWIERSARIVLAAAVLIGLTFILHVAAVVKPRTEARLPLTVEPLGQQIDDPRLTIKGTAPADYDVVVTVGYRTLGRDRASAGGGYSIPIVLPPFGGFVVVEAMAPSDTSRGAMPYRQTVQIPKWRADLVETSVDVAMYIEDAALLWVAGRAAPGQRLELAADGVTLPAHSLYAYGGIFEAVAHLDSPPARITVTRSSEASPRASTNRDVTRTTLADVPLSRRSTVDLSQEWKLKLQVSLPSTHPLLTAARLGYLDGYAAVLGTLGMLAPLRNASVRVVTTGNQSTLVVEGAGWDRRFEWLSSYSSGLDGRPFLSAKDELEVTLPAMSRTWFDGLPPAELTTEKAVWRGPLPATGSPGPIVLVGVEGPARSERPTEDASRETEAPSRNEPERLRDFLVGFEASHLSKYVALPFWLLKALIPFAWLLWLSRAAPFDSSPQWRPFVGALWIFLVWRSWPFLDWLANTALLQWLEKARYRLTEVDHQYINSHESFWLVFVTFVALTPVYFRAVEAGNLPWDGTQVRPSRARWVRALRAAWIGLRAALGGAALFLLVAMVISDWHSYSSNLFPETSAPLGEILAKRGLPAVIFAAVLSLFLLAFGLRAWLVGLGLLLLAIRLVPVKSLESLGLSLPAIQEIPYWAFTVALGALALPLMARLVRSLTPAAFLRRRWHWLIAVLLTTAAMVSDRIPVQLWLIVSGGVLFAALGWLTTVSLKEFDEMKGAVSAGARRPMLALGGLLAVTLFLVWPLSGPNEVLRSTDLSRIALDFRWLLVYVLALGLVLFMRHHAKHNASVILDTPWRAVGIYLFSVLLINSSVSWLLVPVPLIVAFLIATFWLLLSPAELARSVAAGALDSKQLIRGLIDAGAASARFSAIQKVLDKKLDAAELTPEEYENRLGAYRAYLAKAMAGETAGGGAKTADTAFAFGHGSLRDNVRAALGIGVLLVIPLVVIALYQYAPVRGARYPYPVADIVLFLMNAAVNWLLYAFFFGYYYAHIRGTTGLTKGANLCFAIVLPFLAYRLLSTETLTDMWQFLLWAAQVFVFCTLVGLIAFDYRLLRTNGFRARDLLAIHNVPVLFTYSSTMAAAVGSALVAIITNRVTDLAKFFFDVIAGGGIPKQ